MLAEEIPALWQAPGTTATDRKEVVRCLIERVVVHVCPDSEQVGVTIHWQGGSVSEHHVVRPVRRYDQLADFEGLPECKVIGRLTCRELKRDIGWTNVYLWAEGRGPSLGCASEEGTFHFFAPPGTYTLHAYGMKLHSVDKTIVVKPGQRELQVDPLELPATRLALLEGMSAPELSEVAAWKNSPPLKLADLRGKCVLLEFWGAWCGPCIRQMPALFELYDKYHNEGLLIIGVHVDISPDGAADSVTKLDKGLTEARQKVWKGRDIPFPVALARHSQEASFSRAPSRFRNWARRGQPPCRGGR